MVPLKKMRTETHQIRDKVIMAACRRKQLPYRPAVLFNRNIKSSCYIICQHAVFNGEIILIYRQT